MKLRVLGCGTSSGVPRIGNDWGVCDPGNPKNRRRRASIMIEAAGTRILVDTGPDLREQLLDAEVGTVDAVIWTHEHADHCHGIDDLRGMYFLLKGPVQGYARERTRADIEERFPYAFDGFAGYPPYVDMHALRNDQMLGDLRVRVVDLPHGAISSTGLRFDYNGKAAVYATDFNILPDAAIDLFRGSDLWVVDAVRREPHPTHPHLAQTLEWIERIDPGRALITHMDQSMDYDTLHAELPDKVRPAYDGQEIAL